MARRPRVYISSTPFTGKSESELSFSNVARGLVYSRASDDNVHAALNLPLSPPSSREPGRGGALFRRSFLPLHYIIFHSFRRTFPSVASRRAPPPSPSPFSFSSPSSVSTFLFPSLCSYFMRAGVSSRRGESTRITRDASSHEDALTRRTNVYVLITDSTSARKAGTDECLQLIWFSKLNFGLTFHHHKH